MKGSEEILDVGERRKRGVMGSCVAMVPTVWVIERGEK